MCKVTTEKCHVNFAWDLLRSYFHEPQKSEIHPLYYALFLQHFCPFFMKFLFKSRKSVAKKSYNPACLVITFNSHHQSNVT